MFDYLRKKAQEHAGLRGAFRGLLLATVAYGLTPEGMAALSAMGVPAGALAVLAFVGASLRSKPEPEAE